MRFVKCIGGEFFPVFPYLFEDISVVSVAYSAVYKFGFQLHKHRFYLFPHSLTQLVGLSACEARQLPRQQHNLLLIDGDAVGIFQILFHYGNIVRDRHSAVFAVDEIGNIIHRTGAVQSVHCY